MLAIYKDGRQSRIQKIPKEDYIFCGLCEKRFAILETYCSNNFFNIFHNKELKCKFPLKNEIRENASQQYRECECLDPNMFNLFIISLVWRALISSHKDYKGLFCLEQFKELMRIDLNSNMKYNHDLFNKTNFKNDKERSDSSEPNLFNF